jgi:sugar-specific transcriptional regulator TrmB
MTVINKYANFMHLKELLDAGLSENEARVYLAALELGETSIYRLARKSGVKRTTTYLAVETLRQKGLMNSFVRNNVTICYAENPKKLADILEKKKESLNKVMPELLAFTNLIDKKPKIRFFEGEDAYVEVFKDVLRYPKSEMLGTFNERFWDWKKYFTNHFMPERKKKRIWARILFRDKTDFKSVAQEMSEYLTQIKFVPSDKFNIEIEMVVYGKNKVGFVSYEEEIALIIESQKIHDTQKSFFETIWSLV